MKRIYISLLIIALSVSTATAQQNTTPQNGQELHKEITLEKDFVPEVKKATKKNVLPKVKKIEATARTTVNYSDWANPIEVPTSIPTMMPYGYRTAHNFSDKRGYLSVGGGMAANFVGSAGYRIIDTDKTTLGIWLQHNSTWAGKNSSKLISSDSQRLKQQFNDNFLGLDLKSRIKSGTLSFSALGHLDSFNYYGSTDENWAENNKQLFTEFGTKAGWDDEINLNEHPLLYNIGLSFNHAGYDKSLSRDVKAAKENLFNFTLGGEYTINENFAAGLEFQGDYVNEFYNGNNNNYFLFTASPFLRWENHAVKLRAGADILFGKPHLLDYDNEYDDDIDDTKLHVSPNVNIDFNLAEGAALYVNISGGKILNTLSSMAAQNRYSSPLGGYWNTFSPFDGEAGFKIGPFYGFSMKVFGGYGIFTGDLNGIVLQLISSDGEEVLKLMPSEATQYIPFRTRGFKIGGEINYRYRSLIEAKASIAYAPAPDELNVRDWNSGYPLDGLDGAPLVANIDLKVKPMRQLSFDLGMDIRTDRSQVLITTVMDDNDFDWYEMDDVINLYAGASWRFDKVVTLWARGNNLLNRKWDVMPGMGAQKFNVMAGVGLVF